MKKRILSLIPQSPSWDLDWNSIAEFPWVNKLKGSKQDARHHAEGDVFTHVEMVARCGIESSEWQALSDEEKIVTFLCFAGHDVCKPETQVFEADGSITNRGHSRMGANEMRQILWRAGLDFNIRERVCSIISVHQVPFHLLSKKDWEIERFLIGNSLEVSNHLLAVQAMADAKGRICQDQQSIIDNVSLFCLAAEELKCLNSPFVFWNDHTRMQYLSNPEGKNPSAELWDTTSSDFTVTIMSGLPGSGKSTWIEKNRKGGIVDAQPVVSMDELRKSMEVDPRDNQGQVRQAALARAREMLAAKRSFIWDGINLDWQRRTPLVQLCMNYGARVRMVYVETTEKLMLQQNRERKERVPDEVIARMLCKWQPPTLQECHELVYSVPQPEPLEQANYHNVRKSSL